MENKISGKIKTDFLEILTDLDETIKFLNYKKHNSLTNQENSNYNKYIRLKPINFRHK